MPMSKSKYDLAHTKLWWNYNFDIKFKGQGHKEVMNVCDTLSHGGTLM